MQFPKFLTEVNVKKKKNAEKLSHIEEKLEVQNTKLISNLYKSSILNL